MKKILSKILICCVWVLSAISCAPLRVTRTNVSQVTDLSGRWNDTDSRLVAETMSTELMQGAWLSRLRQAYTTQEEVAEAYRKKPVIIVGSVLNKSHEHIEADTFIKDIERSIIEGGAIRIVANSTLREKLRKEKAEQVGFTTLETQKQFGRELGADYMIFGTINAIVDTEGKNSVVFYQVDLELINLETNEKEWIGDKKIKKYIGGKNIKNRYTGSLPAH